MVKNTQMINNQKMHPIKTGDLNVIRTGENMIIFGAWRKIDSLCINCAVPLESRPVWGNQSIIIKGCEPMEYRHVKTGGCEKPNVYSCWNKYSEWKLANKSFHRNT